MSARKIQIHRRQSATVPQCFLQHNLQVRQFIHVAIFRHLIDLALQLVVHVRLRHQHVQSPVDQHRSGVSSGNGKVDENLAQPLYSDRLIIVI